MSHPFYFVLGVAMVGFLVPELLLLFSTKFDKVPLMQNLIFALGAAFIAYSFVG